MGTQIDLFLDSLINAPIKDDRALMEFPFFSIQKRPRMEAIVYDDGRTRVEIQPGPKGIATIWDKDVLIYAASLINDRIERGLPVERTVQFPAHDLLKLTMRGTGKQAYELLKDALVRLRSTTVITTIKSDGSVNDRGFGWIDNWDVLRRTTPDGREVMQAVSITLNDWMFRAIVKERRILTINPAYFTLDKGVERRLYELARKHVGDQAEWRIGLERLARKVGTSRPVRQFKAELLAIIARDAIPDYIVTLEVSPDGGRPVAVFAPRVGSL